MARRLPRPAEEPQQSEARDSGDRSGGYGPIPDKPARRLGKPVHAGLKGVPRGARHLLKISAELIGKPVRPQAAIACGFPGGLLDSSQNIAPLARQCILIHCAGPSDDCFGPLNE
jgi:hypothetical protein